MKFDLIFFNSGALPNILHHITLQTYEYWLTENLQNYYLC